MRMLFDNLESVLGNLDFELHLDRVNETKTLTNTYLKLLQQFQYKFYKEENKIVQQKLLFGSALNSHSGKLEELLKFSHDLLERCLYVREFKESHSIATIIERIEISIEMLNKMIFKINTLKKAININDNEISEIKSKLTNNN